MMNFVDNKDLKKITDCVYLCEPDDIIFKIVPKRNMVFNIEHSFEHLSAVKQIANGTNDSNVVLFPLIFDIFQEPDFSIVAMQYVTGEASNKCNFLPPEIYFKELHILHNQMSNQVGANSIPKMPWDFFPKTYWDYVFRHEKKHHCIRFFEQYQNFSTPDSNLTCNHNDLHFGNFLKKGLQYYIIDLDEVALNDFRSDIGVSCANLYNTHYHTADDLYDFISMSLKHYGLNNLQHEDIITTAIYGLRKLYHAEMFSKIHQLEHNIVADIVQQQKPFENLLEEKMN